MRKMKLMLTLLAIMLATGVWAQDGVVASYLTNADFSQGALPSVGICTYEKDMAQNGTSYYGMQEVPDWQWNVENGDTKAAGLFAYGSDVWLGGPGFVPPGSNLEGSAVGNALGLLAVWGGTVQYVQEVTLPAGTYTLIASIYNAGGSGSIAKSLFGFISND